MTLSYATPLSRRFPSLTQQLPLISTAFVCALLYAIGSICYSGFFSAGTFSEFFAGNAVLGLAAVGLTFVILSGGIDLSVGSMVGFVSILTGMMVERWHWSPAAAVPAVLLLGCAFGLLAGVLIHFFDLAPFLVTLAGMFVLRGLALTIAPVEGRITLNHAFFVWPSTHAVTIGPAGVRLIGIFFIIVACIAAVVLRYTRFGRNVYALGGNEQSALLMGLPVSKTKILVYAISGFCSALAGIVACVDMGAGEPSAAMGLELDAIAAVVIGGTLLTGGVGTVIGTVLGVLILAIIQTGLTLDGRLISWWTKIVIGALLLLFITLQKLLTKATARV
jgi:simple sugar transport system permease protein